mmetsp:Transcript_119454/g.266622  ORF Transcript_119454/g.266622 Transcript_119454/m.266622 type:complete len:540 (+) Transcript_119454:2-1621(+)
MDQRFPACQEHEFRKSLEPSFVIPIYAGSLGAIASCLWTQYHSASNYDAEWLPKSLQLFMIAKDACIVILSLFMLTIFTLRRRWRLCLVDLELLVVVVGAIGLPIICCGSAWYAALLFGEDPFDIFGIEVGASETLVLMTIILATTVSCLVVPIRSHVSWFLPMWGICVFSVVTCATASPHPHSLHTLMFYLCVMSCMSILGGFRNESHLRKEWLAQRNLEKQADISEKQKQGFSHLLCRLCDCLLHLGPNLEILEPCPNLEAMLFRTKSIVDSNFCDYLASRGDHDLFVAAMGRDDSEVESSGILPLHMRDSNCHEVQVHAYYTSFRDQDGTPYHIIGIVEAGGQTHVQEPADQQDIFVSRGSGHLRSATSTGGDSQNGGSEDSIEGEPVAGPDFDDVAITFNDSLSLDIISCTPGFTSLCGPIEADAHFLDWIVNKDPFFKYVQEVGNRFLAIPQFKDELVLTPPFATRAGIEYVIRSCTLDMVTESLTANQEGKFISQVMLRMRLDGIEQRRHRRKRHMPPSKPKSPLHTCLMLSL